MYSDEDIALLIANQAKKQSVLAQRIGPSAFLVTSSAKPFKVGEKASINKSFLANTIRSVETHNRREEIEDCWRQHRLDKRKREDCEDYEHENPSKAENNFEDERAKWSKKKLKAFTAKILIDDETESGEIKCSDESSSSDSSDSSEDKRSKKNKKHHKEKREKKEKKSKKEKKHKKEKSEKKEKKKKRDRSPGEDS